MPPLTCLFGPACSDLLARTCLFGPACSDLLARTCLFGPACSDLPARTCLLAPACSDRPVRTCLLGPVPKRSGERPRGRAGGTCLSARQRVEPQSGAVHSCCTAGTSRAVFTTPSRVA